MHKVSFFAVLMLLFGLSSGQSQESTFADCKVNNYGNGVFFFGCRKDTFGKALGVFRKETKADIVSIASDDTGSFGYTAGYFVIVREDK